mmetsp:Transcript_34713/g.79178  ORF Transcript_34713/g.79178 Transcript_34713/m.79178 type:complete len:230 (+) Transcript_34713:525-1214(+)
MRQLRLELIETRLTKACRWIPNDASHNAARRVLRLPGFQNFLNHLVCNRLVRAPNNILVDVRSGDWLGLEVASGLNLSHSTHPRHDIHPIFFSQELLGNGSRSDTTNSLPSARTASTAGRTVTVFDLVRVVCVARARDLVHLCIIPGALVHIFHEQPNRSSESVTAFSTRQDLDPVALVTGRGHGALARASAVQLDLDIRFTEGNTRRTAIKNGTDACAVRLAECGHAK